MSRLTDAELSLAAASAIMGPSGRKVIAEARRAREVEVEALALLRELANTRDPETMTRLRGQARLLVRKVEREAALELQAVRT